MALFPPSAAPLRVQAAAAVSLLAEGVLPEDVGAAAGLANPAGGDYTPGVLADLADAIRRAAVSAAAALDRDGASGFGADAAWADGDETVDYRDSDNAPWWDPEALAALLCATRVADGVAGALGASDQAVLARGLADTHGWSTRDVGDLMWCIHTAQHADARSVSSHSDALSRGHLVTMARVEQVADLALELCGDGGVAARAARRPSAPSSAAEATTDGWSRAEASALFPRALPATDWDRGNGLHGLTAVEGCALLAAALAAGGTAGRGDDGGDALGDADGFSAARARAEYPRLSDARDRGDSNARAKTGWPVSDISAALRAILDEPAEDGSGDRDETGAANEAAPRRERGFGDAARGRPASPSSSAPSSSASESDDAVDAGVDALSTARVRRRARLLGSDANSNVVGAVNARSRRGVAGRGGGGVARASGPALGPAAACGRRAPGGGWDAASAARLAATLHGTYGWDVAPCARLAADVLGWEGRSPEAAAAAAAAVRAPDAGWNAENAAALVAALAAPSDDDAATSEPWDGTWDVPGFVTPLVDALVGTHDWSPRETAALLEHLQVWSAEDAASLARGALDRGWAEAGVAGLLGALMEWRHRDRAEVAHVVRALVARSSGDGRAEWPGGGVLGKLLGVREGEARAAASVRAAEEPEGDSADAAGTDALARSAAASTLSSRGRRRGGGGGGGGGETVPPHAFLSDPVVAIDACADSGGDGYSADAD